MTKNTKSNKATEKSSAQGGEDLKKSKKLTKKEKQREKRSQKYEAKKQAAAKERQQQVLLKKEPLQLQQHKSPASGQQSIQILPEDPLSFQQESEGDYEAFDPEFKGKHGFQELVMDSLTQNQAQVSHSVFKIELSKGDLASEKAQLAYLYCVKRERYYRFLCEEQERMNTTHLKQTVSVQVAESDFNAFEVNGKKEIKKHDFIRSTVLRTYGIHQTKNSSNSLFKNQKSKKSKGAHEQSNGSTVQELIEGLSTILSSNLNNNHELIEFLEHSYDRREDCLLISSDKLCLAEVPPPFEKLPVQSLMASNDSLLVLGDRNTGKSTLSEYFRNRNPKGVCILDCDIGRSLTIAGCVSLLTPELNYKIWIGEFTPLNCLQKYLRAIGGLYAVYRERHFGQKLVINTMGYLSGLGEAVIYEIYSAINPSEIVVLSAPKGSRMEVEESQQHNRSTNPAEAVLQNIQSGAYQTRLLSCNPYDQEAGFRFKKNAVNCSVHRIVNHLSQGKGVPIRFESLISQKYGSIHSVAKLIRKFKCGCFQKIPLRKLRLFEQNKYGRVEVIERPESLQQMGMRIVLLGEELNVSLKNEQFSLRVDENQLLRIHGVGYAYQEWVYHDNSDLKQFLAKRKGQGEQERVVGVFSENVDFEKSFYQTTEANLIRLELEFGQIPYMAPIVRGLGSKGVRARPVRNL